MFDILWMKQCQSGGALVGLKDTNSGQQNKRNYQEFQSSISSTKSFQFMWEVNNLNDARLLRVLPDGKSLVFSHRSSGGESMLTQVVTRFIFCHVCLHML